MKVIILAGGWGTRLGKLTAEIPKPMVKIGGKPILWHIMKSYSSYGYNEFIIALGVMSDVIKNYFINYEMQNSDFTISLSNGDVEYHNSCRENWKVTLVDTGINTLKGGRLKRVSKYLNDDTNMLTYGDGLTDANINHILKFHKAHKKIVTMTGVYPPARFGELSEEDGKVIKFQEKPQASTGLINGGYMVFNERLLDFLSEDENCDLEFGAIEKLTKKNEVMVYKHEGNWECMDHERDVVHLNKLWIKGSAFWKKWN